MAFSDSLPAGLAVAAVANAKTTCPTGVLSAPGTGNSISFSDGSIAGSSSCTVEVDVTSVTPGTHTNTTGDLTSSAGNSDPATADLVVDASRPGFTKAFSPSSVSFGGRSTLTLTIDNSRNDNPAGYIAFVDNLPAGMVVANPANLTTTCSNSVISATPGGSLVSYSTPFSFPPPVSVDANASCTVSLDVVANAIGTLNNITGELTSGQSPLSSGKASAALTVVTPQLNISKSFTNDPVAPGQTVDLSFTIRNLNRGSAASDISFTDDLDAVVPGLAASALPATPCGAGSSLTGDSQISLVGGTLPAGGSCTFVVPMQVPATADAGNFDNLTTQVSGTIDGQSVIGNSAHDVLVVAAVPVLTKQYLDSPVAADGSTRLAFTLTNSSPTYSATDLAFTDLLPSFVVSNLVTSPATGFCGAGSTASVNVVTTDTFQLSISGANLAAGASCDFMFELPIAKDAPSGTYINTTSAVTGVVNGSAVTGSPATDDLLVVAAPKLIKEFIDDPVAPGDPVTLRFTLKHGTEAQGDAVDIAFSDDLNAALTGMTATGLPLNDICGQGSTISGTGNLSFSGGSLQPGESCSFDLTLQTPAAAASGVYTNTTSNVVATVLGLSVTGNSATDDLHLYGLTFDKSFTNDPALAGGTVTLEYTLTNTDPSAAASNMVFTDNVGSVLSGMTATGLPVNDICGTGSSLTGTGTLIFQAGSLAAGDSCTFSVNLQVPAGAVDGQYNSTTSKLMAEIDGSTVLLGSAYDVLTVSSSALAFSKQFLNDPVAPGTSVDLQFTLSNPTAQTVTGLSFTDDLAAVLPGLASSSGTLSGICGAGSSIDGTDLLTFTGGSLAAGSSCSFSVTLAVPVDVLLGSVLSNVTSPLTGDINGLSVFADPATDELLIDYLEFSKGFSGPAIVGGTTTLTFSLRNASTTETVSQISFTDDLEATLSGLVATDVPKSNVCGTGSILEGSSLLSLRGAELLPSGSCSFSVDLQIPATALPGDYLNETSELLAGGVHVAAPASATLTVIENADADNDGVNDDVDMCPGTVIPEATVPSKHLKPNRYALLDGDFIFDRGESSKPPHRKNVFTTTDTAGCSCEQIIAERHLGKGHKKFGCSKGIMRKWVKDVGIWQRPEQPHPESNGRHDH